jgi:hypothetical protein
MSTQGLLSITRRGKTVAKIVAGCNGMYVPALAGYLREHPETDPFKLVELCRKFSVCCDRCLVIQCSPIDFTLPENEEFEPGPDFDRWKRTFQDPHFNPRWDHGTAPYTEIVDLDLCQKRPQQKSK